MTGSMQSPLEQPMPTARGGGAVDTRAAFADYVGRRLLTVNPTEMQRLSVVLYRLLGRGAPVAHDQLGATCSISRERVAQLLLEFPPTALALDERGAIIAFGGLSLTPTHHRFVTKEVTLYTWCVFDSLFLPKFSANRQP
jgi:alkylmercury lyase